MRKLIAFFILIFTSPSLLAQDQVDFVQDQAQNQEIYVHFDRPFYLGGETIWFSLYNYRADNHQLIFGRRFMQLTLVDKNKQVVKKERIRVVDGKTWGQLTIPDNLTTGNYLFLVTYPFEAADNFLYRKVIPIYNPNDELPTSAPLDVFVDLPDKMMEFKGISTKEEILTITPDKSSYERREPITISLNLPDELTGKASIVVREKTFSGSQGLDIRTIAMDPGDSSVDSHLSAVERTNFRENKPLNWRLVDSHGLLLYELIQTDSAPESSIPYVYIPEDRMTHGIFEVRPKQFVFDATDVSGDEKSLYFSSFTFGTFGAESQGEQRFDWIYRATNYNNIIPKELNRTLELSPSVAQYIQKRRLRTEVLSSYGSNLVIETKEEDVSGLQYRPAIWKKADDYTEMSSLPEFLREIVLGLRVWDRRNKYDLRLNFVGGRYPYAPFYLVNGVPTWDTQRVLEIPMKDIFGVGVIKDLQTETGQARDARAELERFGYFGSNGILSVELRPGVANPFQSEYNNLLKRQFYLEAQSLQIPEYTLETQKSFIPDFRPVLYWNPNVVFAKEGNPKISFFASDDSGEYEVIVEGIGKNGEIIYGKKIISIGKGS